MRGERGREGDIYICIYIERDRYRVRYFDRLKYREGERG